MEVDDETIVAALTAKYQQARRDFYAGHAARLPGDFKRVPQAARERAAEPGSAAVPAASVALAAPFAASAVGRTALAAKQPAASGTQNLDAECESSPAAFNSSFRIQPSSFPEQVPPAERWPAPCGAAAFHGLAGEVVRSIASHSEAAPVALLVQFLAAFGNCIGRSAHWQAGQDKHYGNLFCLLVGHSPKDRKGTSWNAIHQLFSAADQKWGARLWPALPDAESLRRHVRCVQEAAGSADFQPANEGGQDGRAPRDSRLLLLESEFGQAWRQLGRPGNTLPLLLRQAWKLKTTGIHISIIGHVTQRELQRRLPLAASPSGLGDHFLWVCVKRSKLLPQGGQAPEEEMAQLSKKVEAAINFSAGVRLLKRAEAAEKLWGELYPRLSIEREGLAAAVCGRAEAQVMRLAMLYALLDHQDIIAPCHLESAVALWRYCEESVYCLFGETLGDKMAESLAAVLRRRPHGLTRNDIYDHYMRHKSSTEIRQALTLLWRAGLARFEKQNSGGRPIERWFYCEGNHKICAISAKSGGETPEVYQPKEVAIQFTSGTICAISAKRVDGKNHEVQQPKELTI